MTELDQLLNFFGNPDLDRHRLLQGKWPAYRYEPDDPEGCSDDPLELLLLMLVEALPRGTSDTPPALQALGALLSTALQQAAGAKNRWISSPIFQPATNPNKPPILYVSHASNSPSVLTNWRTRTIKLQSIP